MYWDILYLYSIKVVLWHSKWYCCEGIGDKQKVSSCQVKKENEGMREAECGISGLWFPTTE